MVNDSMLLTYGLGTGFIACFLGVASMIIGAQSCAKKGWRYGLAVGLGNLFAQTIWITIAAMTMFSGGKVSRFDTMFTWVGVVIILFIAYKMFTQKETSVAQAGKEAQVDYSSWFPLFAGGFLLSISAPQRILFYVGVFSGFGVHFTTKHLFHLVPLVGGTMVGIASWWAIFLLLMSKLRAKLTARHCLLMSKCGAVLLGLMGLGLLASMVLK